MWFYQRNVIFQKWYLDGAISVMGMDQNKRMTVRPQMLCCSLYMFLQLCCPYQAYQYNSKFTNYNADLFIMALCRFLARRSSDWYGQIMEQTLLMTIMNYRKHWKSWIIKNSRITCKKMVRIGFCGTRTHLEHHIWEMCGNAEFKQQEVSRKDC